MNEPVYNALLCWTIVLINEAEERGSEPAALFLNQGKLHQRYVAESQKVTREKVRVLTTL